MIQLLPREVLCRILLICSASPRKCLIHVCRLWYAVVINHIHAFIDVAGLEPSAPRYSHLPAISFGKMTFEQKIRLANDPGLHNADVWALARLYQRYRVPWHGVFEYMCYEGVTMLNGCDIEHFPRNAHTYFVALMSSCEQFRRDVLMYVPPGVLERMAKHYTVVARRLRCDCSDTLYTAIWQYLNANSPSTVVYRTYEEHTRLRAALQGKHVE